MKISVIVPVYNVEKYLAECLDSIISQTHKNLEIILVDDGSTDESGRICEEYAGRDKRIRVIHQKCSGVSAARNTGLEYVTGDFIAFIDSDDWIDASMLEELLKQIVDNHTEMAMCNVRRFTEEDDVEDEVIHVVKDEVLSRDEMVQILTGQLNWYYTVLWNKMYKKEIFDDIRFPVGYIHEDEAVIHYILGKCNNVACTRKVLYHYRKHAASITGDSKRINRTDILTALADRIKYADNQKWGGSCEIKQSGVM